MHVPGNHTGNSRDVVFHDLIFHVDNLIIIHLNENPFNRVIYTIINFGPEPFDWKIRKTIKTWFFVRTWKIFDQG